jgi:SEC-C motif domain protein
MKLCYCGSNFLFEDCCEPYIKNHTLVPTAEALMRSRYSAYCIANVDYLVATTHLSTRKQYPKSSILEFASNNHWLQLEIISATENSVEFKAYFLDKCLKPNVHHEKSTFVKENDYWFYIDGEYF